MEQIRDLVLAIARALVDDPEQVKVNIIEGSNSLVLELSVSKGDVGKVIGKQVWRSSVRLHQWPLTTSNFEIDKVWGALWRPIELKVRSRPV